MSEEHSRRRARSYRHTKLGEFTLFILELVLLAVAAGITYALSFLNFLGSAFFGMGAIVLGLYLASGGGMIYTANNKKQYFHTLGFIMLILYILGLLINAYVYQLGSWLVNATYAVSSLGFFVGIIVGIEIFIMMLLSVVDAKAQNMT